MAKRMYVVEIPRLIAFETQGHAAAAIAVICGTMTGTVERKWGKGSPTPVFRHWGCGAYDENPTIYVMDTLTPEEFEVELEKIKAAEAAETGEAL